MRFKRNEHGYSCNLTGVRAQVCVNKELDGLLNEINQSDKDVQHKAC